MRYLQSQVPMLPIRFVLLVIFLAIASSDIVLQVFREFEMAWAKKQFMTSKAEGLFVSLLLLGRLCPVETVLHVQ